MNTWRIYGLAMICWFLGNLNVGHAEEPPALRVHAVWLYDRDPSWYTKPLEKGAKILFMVVFENQGERPIRICCPRSSLRFQQFSMVDGVRYGDIEYEIYFRAGAFCHHVIPSASDLRIIELRRNERTELQLEFELSAHIDLGTLQLVYEVSPDIGRRFDTWSGRLKCMFEHQPNVLRHE